MKRPNSVGKSYPRKDGPDKVHGRIRYTDDIHPPGTLHTAFVISPHAHAVIVSIDTATAEASPGVCKVVTGADFDILLGIYLGDKPPLARGKVRHFGEPVAAVIADTPYNAATGARLIRVEYEPLPPVNSIQEAMDYVRTHHS